MGRRDDAAGLTPGELAAHQRRRKAMRKHKLQRMGYILMAIGILIGLTHWLGHLGLFGGEPTGLQDLLVGYPTAFILFFAGVIAWGQ